MRAFVNKLEERLSAMASNQPSVPKDIVTKAEFDRILSPLSSALNAQIQSIWQDLNGLRSRLGPIEQLPPDAVEKIAAVGREQADREAALKALSDGFTGAPDTRSSAP